MNGIGKRRIGKGGMDGDDKVDFWNGSVRKVERDDYRSWTGWSRKGE